jgi:hypothetical protein
MRGDVVHECAFVALAATATHKPDTPLLQVTGVLQHTDYLKPWQHHPDVLYARPLVQPGHK